MFYKLNGSKYEINHDFFQVIDDEIKAYLLGFYVADGNVNEKRKTFRVNVSSIDSEIINLYRNHIGPNCRIYKKEPYNIIGRNGTIYTGNEQIVLDINSSVLVKSLVSLGYGYRKSWKELKLPDISNNLVIPFIRGYFDGDGSVCVWNCIEKGKKDRLRCTISFVNKRDSLLIDIKEFLYIYGINFNKHYLSRDDMYRISSSSKENVKKFYDLIYKDATYFLSRKKEKLESYVNTEILHKTNEDCNA